MTQKQARDKLWREQNRDLIKARQSLLVYRDVDFIEPEPKPCARHKGMGAYEVSPESDKKTITEYIVAECVGDQPGLWELLGTRYANQGADIRLVHTGTRRLYRVAWRSAENDEGWNEHPECLGKRFALSLALRRWLAEWEEPAESWTPSKSGFRGVTWHKHRRLWRASIMRDGVRKYLGIFSDAADAARAFDKAARAHDGPTARLNFPSVVIVDF